MNLADHFIPTAGAVGLLPMVTYFFMVVAILAFLGLFILALTACAVSLVGLTAPQHRHLPVLTAVAAAVTGLIYYLIQSYYFSLLAELPPVSDPADRQTLIREAYNAIGQYRYMAWFITTPLLLIQLFALLNLQLQANKRMLVTLLGAALFMVFAGYLGHEQLSFDNEIQVGPKVSWGLASALAFGFIAFTLNRLGKESGKAYPNSRPALFIFLAGWAVYFLGYFLTTLAVDFNWIHMAYTLMDLVTVTGIGLISFTALSKATD